MAPALLEGVRQAARVPAKAVRCWSRAQIEGGPLVVAGLNRRRATRQPPLRKQLDRHIAWLQEAVRCLDQDLQRLIRSTPMSRETKDLLSSVPRVGNVAAAARANSADFARVARQ